MYFYHGRVQNTPRSVHPVDKHKHHQAHRRRRRPRARALSPRDTHSLARARRGTRASARAAATPRRRIAHAGPAVVLRHRRAHLVHQRVLHDLQRRDLLADAPQPVPAGRVPLHPARVPVVAVRARGGRRHRRRAQPRHDLRRGPRRHLHRQREEAREVRLERALVDVARDGPLARLFEHGVDWADRRGGVEDARHL